MFYLSHHRRGLMEAIIAFESPVYPVEDTGFT
jgi:hypothetical protein